MSTWEPERRRHLQEMLEAWIDQLAEAEPPLDGVAPAALEPSDAAPDLFSMLSALEALTREVHLLARTTHRLNTEVAAGVSRLTEITGGQQAIAKLLAEARREARLELVSELLDVRDRLTRSLGEASRRLARLRGFRAHLGQRPVLQALVDGVTLARERLDDLLGRLDVRELPCLGQAFDPTVMRGVEVAHDSPARPGTVIEVIRPGYTAEGRVIRFAEVKVAAGAASETRGDENG